MRRDLTYKLEGRSLVVLRLVKETPKISIMGSA